MNQTVCALRFLYGITLKQAELPERIPHARTPRKLPVVLSADEVVCFLEAVPSLKARAALTTAYAAGLRASEAAGIKVADIDSRRMVIRVEHGKGAKADETATSRSRRSCSASFARIGGWRARSAGCFLAAMASNRSVRPCCTQPAARPAPPPG